MLDSDKRLLNVLYRIFHPIYRYSGIETICNKARITEEQQPKKILPSLPLWLIGIYVAAYGVASQRYENKVDIIESKVNTIYPQLTSNDAITKGMAFRRIPMIQKMDCPYKPNIINPFTIYLSFLKNSAYEGVDNLMKETVENWKSTLVSIDLSGANLKYADLKNAVLKNTNLKYTNFMGAVLQGADLRDAVLVGANLTDANLEGADFKNTDLHDADFFRANLQSANLEGANLQGTRNLIIDQLSTAYTLCDAKLEPVLMEQVRRKYPHLLEKPKPDE